MRYRCTALTAAATLAAVFAVSAEPPIVPGDPREGYETSDFRTSSQHLREDGAALDLAALVAHPPLGLPPFPSTVEPPMPARVALGRKLFYDRRLSANGTLSCAMCHIPEQGFTHNELATPVGIEGRDVKRNAPALYNVVYRTALFHDGRETSLVEQVWSPLTAENEMGNASRTEVVARVAAAGDYRAPFEAAFGGAPSAENIGEALAAYQRTLLSADSPFDRFWFRHDEDALDATARAGFALFVAKGCSGCHSFDEESALFTDGGFHDTGIGYHAATRRRDVSRVLVAPGVFIDVTAELTEPDADDFGRFEATHDEADRWKYRTPSLRNVALTAPYMHDGSLPTLARVIDYYDRGGTPHPGQDPRLVPLGLSADERAALVRFLEALTGSNVAALARDARSTAIGDVSYSP